MSIKDASVQLQQNNLVALLDDTAIGGHGFLFGRADVISQAQINFFVREAKGVICAPISTKRARDLGLPMMEAKGEVGGPAFTVSVEARSGVSTGISAADRARTLRVLATTSEPLQDLVQPGHIFPLVSTNGGVLSRRGVPEAIVDLLNLSGCNAVGASSIILGVDGEPLKEEGVRAFCAKHKLVLVKLSELIQHRMRNEVIVEKVAETQLPVRDVGTFRAHGFRSLIDSSEHLVLTKGEFDGTKPILARVQTENPLGDLFSGGGMFTHRRNIEALKAIERDGVGIFVYVRHPRRGLLRRHVESLSGNSNGSPKTMDLREYGIGSQILRHFGACRIRLLSNTTTPLPNLSGFNIEVVERVPFGEKA